MIRVSYNRKETIMTIKGHAGAAPAGQDLVCAGASTLGFTLIAALMDSKEKFMPNISQQSGDLRIACRPGKSHVTPCRRVMDTIFTGYEILANDYPDFVIAKRED